MLCNGLQWALCKTCAERAPRRPLGKDFIEDIYWTNSKATTSEKKKKQKQNERDAACAGKVFGKIKIMPTGSFCKKITKDYRRNLLLQL